MADITGMLQAAAGNAGEDVDPDFANTVLLLHGDGTNGAQNNTFLDSSTNNFTITRAGNTTQGTFTPFSKPDGRWGNSFLGDTDYITCTSNAAYQFNTSDFTIECWLYTTALVGSASKIFQYATDGNFSSGGYGLEQVTNANTLTWGRSTGVVTLTSAAPTNEWFHFAIVHSSGTLTAYLNGVSVYSAADSYNYNYGGTYPFAIGSGRNGSGNFTDDYTGYISNFRVVKGTAVYTAAFTPPTTPLTAITNTSLLTCQSNRFVDNSANAFAITATGTPKVTPLSPFPLTTEYTPSVNSGSAYLDGSGDFLTVGTTINWSTFGSYTLEFWAYHVTLATIVWYLVSDDFSAGETGWYVYSDGSIAVGINTVNQIVSSAGAVKAGQWQHIAYTYDGTTTKIYVNGVEVASDTTAVYANVSATISTGTGGGNTLVGYLSGMRIVSSVVYASAFTPPTAPPTAISGTHALLNFTNAGIFDNTGFNNLETVADAQIDTTTKKYGTGSLEFDGTGDYLVAPHSTDQNIGGGDWTGECWVYVTTKSSSVFFAKGPGGGAWEYFFGYDGATLSMFYGGGSSTTLTDNITLNTWTHVALVRNGTTLTAYVSGSSVGSVTYTGTYTSTSNLGIGGAIPLVGSGYVMKGFIDDLRISRIARYTTTFTPPTKAFPNIGA